MLVGWQITITKDNTFVRHSSVSKDLNTVLAEARAKRMGTKSGRPIGRPRLDQAKEVAAQELLRSGMGILKVARALKIGTGTVSRISAHLR
jgi:DNA invertase Pin-like site-specific DNA recombinase